jgi:hypothetical protein
MSRPQNRAELISVKPAELDAALEKEVDAARIFGGLLETSIPAVNY